MARQNRNVTHGGYFPTMCCVTWLLCSLHAGGGGRGIALVLYCCVTNPPTQWLVLLLSQDVKMRAELKGGRKNALRENAGGSMG